MDSIVRAYCLGFCVAVVTNIFLFPFSPYLSPDNF